MTRTKLVALLGLGVLFCAMMCLASIAFGVATKLPVADVGLAIFAMAGLALGTGVFIVIAVEIIASN